MPIPITVDTFEHDIADEIRHKEASIEDIASATGDIGNKPTEDSTTKSNSALISIVAILILCGIIGASYLAYLYYVEGPATEAEKQKIIATEKKKNNPGVALEIISPVLAQQLGTFLTNVQKTSAGYSIEINSFSPVFAYMIKNEQSFGDDLSLAVGNNHTIKTKATSTQVIQQNTSHTASSSLASSTQVTGTSTKSVTTSTTTTNSEAEEELPTSFIFQDITISNVNMRVATSIYGTVAYAFIGKQKLVIASSTDGILQLRSSILHK